MTKVDYQQLLSERGAVKLTKEKMATPTLSTLEWTASAKPLRLPSAAVVKMQSLTESPRKPGARLRSAARRLGK